MIGGMLVFFFLVGKFFECVPEVFFSSGGIGEQISKFFEVSVFCLSNQLAGLILNFNDFCTFLRPPATLIPFGINACIAFNGCLNLGSDPSRVFVMASYDFIWNICRKNVKHRIRKDKCHFIDIKLREERNPVSVG